MSPLNAPRSFDSQMVDCVNRQNQIMKNVALFQSALRDNDIVHASGLFFTLWKAAYDFRPLLKTGVLGTARRFFQIYVLGSGQLPSDPFLQAQCYKWGIGINPDMKKAVSLLLELEKSKNLEGLTVATKACILAELADCYVTGKGVTFDENKGLALYRQAAEEGLGIAQLFLGNQYLNRACEYGHRRHVDRAFMYLNAASDQNLPQAQALLAWLFQEHKRFQSIEGNEKEFDARSSELSALAAAQGHSWAKYNLAQLTKQENPSDVQRLNEEAAKQEIGNAIYDLAILRKNEGRIEEARQFARQLYELHSSTGMLSWSTAILARILIPGFVSDSTLLAVAQETLTLRPTDKLYTEDAATKTAAHLGWNLITGINIEQDIPRGLGLLRQAAQKDPWENIYLIGYYLDRDDIKNARKYFKRLYNDEICRENFLYEIINTESWDLLRPDLLPESLFNEQTLKRFSSERIFMAASVLLKKWEEQAVPFSERINKLLTLLKLTNTTLEERRHFVSKYLLEQLHESSNPSLIGEIAISVRQDNSDLRKLLREEKTQRSSAYSLFCPSPNAWTRLLNKIDNLEQAHRRAATPA